MSGFPPHYEDDAVAFGIVRKEGATPPLLALSGEMDLRAAAELREALLKALADGEGRVVLDMSELTFIDSTTISVLIMARKRADAAGGEVTVRGVPDRVQRIFTITGIDSLFPRDRADTATGSDAG